MPITKGQGNPNWTKEETILALDLLLKADSRFNPFSPKEVGHLSELLRSLPIHPPEDRRKENFRNATGVYMKLQNLRSCDPSTSGGLRFSATDKEVWDELHNNPARLRALAATIEAGRNLSGDDAEERITQEEELWEGKFITKIHKARERKRFRKKVIARVRKKYGDIRCETCGLTPRISGSPKLEEAAFEAHHIRPLAELGETRNSHRDLALMCANCHRLIHAFMRESKAWISVPEFADILLAHHPE